MPRKRIRGEKPQPPKAVDPTYPQGFEPDMDIYPATMIAELVQEATPAEMLRAWATLIKSGVCWSLQGWFGRNAASLIERGLIGWDGVVQQRALDLLSEDCA